MVSAMVQEVLGRSNRRIKREQLRQWPSQLAGGGDRGPCGPPRTTFCRRCSPH